MLPESPIWRRKSSSNVPCFIIRIKAQSLLRCQSLSISLLRTAGFTIPNLHTFNSRSSTRYFWFRGTQHTHQLAFPFHRRQAHHSSHSPIQRQHSESTALFRPHRPPKHQRSVRVHLEQSLCRWPLNNDKLPSPLWDRKKATRPPF